MAGTASPGMVPGTSDSHARKCVLPASIAAIDAALAETLEVLHEQHVQLFRTIGKRRNASREQIERAGRCSAKLQLACGHVLQLRSELARLAGVLA